MAKNSIATSYVQIVPSADGLKGKLSELFSASMPSAGQSAGSLLGGNLVGALKTVIASAGLGAAVKNALSEGMELEQNLGGTAAVFGDFAQQIQSSAQQAYQNMGLSASDYMATANKMGSLFQGSGLEQQRAMELTAQAMQRAADVASVMGLDINAAMESIAGAAKGNFTMMDNLGVSMNAATLEAYALEKGLNFKWNTASNAEKAELAMKMFFDRTEQYAGNFARESEETLAGSLGAVQAAWSNVLGQLTLGGDLSGPIAALAETALTYLTGNFIPAVWNIVSALPGALVSLIGQLIPENALALVNEGVGQLSLFLTEQLPLLLEQGVGMVTELANGFLTGIPGFLTAAAGLLEQLLSAILSALPSLLSGGYQLIVNLASGLGLALPEILVTAGELIGGLLFEIASHLPELLEQGITLICELAAGLIAGIPDAVVSISQTIDEMVWAFLDYDWLQVGADILEGIARGLYNGVGTIVEAAKEAAKAALDAAKDFLGIQSPSRRFRDEVGKQSAAGIALGIRENTALVDSAMTELSGRMLSSELALGVSASRAVRAGGSRQQAVTVVQNIYSEAKTASDLMLEARYQQEMAVLLGV